MSTFTSKKDFDTAYATLFTTFASGHTKQLAWRRWQLKQLWWLLEDNDHRIQDALKADLNRHLMENAVTDMFGLRSDILDTLTNLDKWTSTTKINSGFFLGTLGKARLRKEPLGVALIVGSWNFPFLLLLQPLIAAIAAGCCVMLKPSELSLSSQNLLAELVPKYLDRSAIALVTGGPSDMSYILEHRFNQIFFTGSSKVARFIAAAAAKHLTPTVLELGGQGPCVVTKTADVDFAARRITWAKFSNAGQICLTVNHAFAEPEIVDELLSRLTHWNNQYLREGSGHMCRLVNERNFDRLAGLLDRTAGTIVYGGNRDRKSKYIEPTIVKDITLEGPLMSEELFGPILPVITATVDQAIESINKLPEPLALYIFSNNSVVTEHIMDSTISGGVTINNVVFHAALHNAPFGGVGESGYGAYHGPFGVGCFSHSRPVVQPPTWMDRFMGITYPPYNVKNLQYLKVKNKLSFKRGETLKDQTSGARRSWGVLITGAILLFGVIFLYSDSITRLLKL